MISFFTINPQKYAIHEGETLHRVSDICTSRDIMYRIELVYDTTSTQRKEKMRSIIVVKALDQSVWSCTIASEIAGTILTLKIYT